MSGHDIPYQLRPNKFIDRQMFLEVLARLVGKYGPENYIYVSMGGRHLIDHHAVYDRLGIEALYAFDKDAHVVARQEFNKPTNKAVCKAMSSADLPGKIDEIVEAFPTRENLIVWLDYTDVRRRLEQLQEAVQTLERMAHGDIFRITLNADPRRLPTDGWKDAGAKGPYEYRAEQLRGQIPRYLPVAIKSISDSDLPKVLASCVEIAAKKAEAAKPNLQITPVLITSYDDGTPMLTVTCAVSDKNEADKFPPAHFLKWKFACRGWDDVRMIYAPTLSAREQHRFNEIMHRSPKEMLAALSFKPGDDDEQCLRALSSYKSLHRYYPVFRHVDE